MPTSPLYQLTSGSTIGTDELVFQRLSDPVTLNQETLGQELYPRTAAEISVGITPVQYQYPVGHVLRYAVNTTPGTTDMTAAIQAAVNVQDAASTYDIATLYEYSIPAVDLGSEELVVSSAVTYGTALRVTGQGARLKPSASTFFCFEPTAPGDGWRIYIDGVSCIGGKFLDIDNNNLDAGLIKIRECRLLECVQAFDVDAQSSQMVVEDCLLYKCNTIANINACDDFQIIRGWIKEAARTANEQASINNSGKLQMQGVLLVPASPGAYTETAWINNNYDAALVAGGGKSGGVYIDRCRFGGETGSKTIVNNYADADLSYEVIPTGVWITNSELYSVNGTTGTTRGMIRLFALPNVIFMRGNSGFVDCLPLVWGTGVTPATEVSGKETYCQIVLDNEHKTKYNVYDDPTNWMLPDLYDIEAVGRYRNVTAASTTLTNGLSGFSFTNTGSAANNNVVLPTAIAGLEFTIRRDSATYKLRAVPQAADKIIGASAANKYLEITTDGVGVHLKCHVDGFWDIVGVINQTYGTGYGFEP
jgi:hypothetical protein